MTIDGTRLKPDDRMSKKKGKSVSKKNLDRLVQALAFQAIID